MLMRAAVSLQVKAGALLVIAVLLIAAGPVFAQDPAQPGANEAEAMASEAPADEAVTGTVETAIAEVPTNTPTYRGNLLYPRFQDESPHEAFMRLAEDFLYTSEIGGNSFAGRVPVWPRGAIKLGPFQIFPYLVGSISWSDNVYEDEREKSSWYWTAGGGFTGAASFSGGRGSIGFGLDYRYEDYLQQDDLNNSEWVASVHVGYAFPFGLWFRAGMKYEDLTRPVGSDYTSRSPRTHFTPFIDMGFTNAFGNKVNIDFGIQYENTDFARDAYETGDHNTTRVWVKVSYPFIKESSRLYVRYEYTWESRSSNAQNPLNNGNELVAGIEGAIPLTRTEKLVGFLEVGYQAANFAGPDLITHNTVTDDDSSPGSGVLRARLRYRLGPKTSMDVSVVKDMEFSTRGNYADRWFSDYNVTYNLARRLVTRGTAYLEWTKASGDNTTVTRFGFGVGARYLLTENFDLFSDLNWNRRNTIRAGWDTSWVTFTLGVTIYLR